MWIILLVLNRSHRSSAYNLNREVLCLSPVIILAASTCKSSKILESLIEQLSQTISPYSRIGRIHALYIITSDLRFILYFNILRRLSLLAALSWIVCTYVCSNGHLTESGFLDGCEIEIGQFLIPEYRIAILEIVIFFSIN